MPHETHDPTVRETILDLAAHPIPRLVHRWNWKSAILSAAVRGTLFFTANLSAGLAAASGAMMLESAFYIVTAGFYGALLESFRKAQPAWKATLVMMVMLPSINHTLEFLLHWIGGTEKIAAGMTASIAFSIVSATFNLYVMRRGALIVGPERQSLLHDLARMPRLIVGFILHVPGWLLRRK